MERVTPFTSATAPAEHTPAATVPPAASSVAALTVELRSRAGTAAFGFAANEATHASDAQVTPRRTSLARSIARPRARRLLTVPTGQPRCLAALSCGQFSRSQRIKADR